MVILSWYESSKGKAKARDVYLTGNDDLQAEFDNAILYLSALPRKEWTRPRSAKLKKCKEDFYEIRLKANNVQHRPIGFWIDDVEFIILLWAKEKDNKIIPIEWCSKASKMRTEIINGKAKRKPVINDINNKQT